MKIRDFHLFFSCRKRVSSNVETYPAGAEHRQKGENLQMQKNNIRGKISQFLKSEEGRVGVKSPLALGIASASVLLAQAMVTPSAQAHLTCVPDGDDCPEGTYCAVWCDEWSAGTCIGEWHSQCEVL